MNKLLAFILLLFCLQAQAKDTTCSDSFHVQAFGNYFGELMSKHITPGEKPLTELSVSSIRMSLTSIITSVSPEDPGSPKCQATFTLSFIVPKAVALGLLDQNSDRVYQNAGISTTISSTSDDRIKVAQFVASVVYRFSKADDGQEMIFMPGSVQEMARLHGDSLDKMDMTNSIFSMMAANGQLPTMLKMQGRLPAWWQQ